MGVPPNTEPNIIECAFSGYPNGMQPDAITGYFTGLYKNYDPTGESPEPFNGPFNLAFVNCWLYRQVIGRYTIELHLFYADITLTQRLPPSNYSFVANGTFNDALYMENEEEGEFNTYLGGYASLDLRLGGVGSKALWTPSMLIGVPQTEKYFAEQSPNGAGDDTYRYASHKDGTNITMKLDI